MGRASAVPCCLDEIFELELCQNVGYDRQPVLVVFRRCKQVGYGALTALSWAGGKGGDGESFSAVAVHLPVDGRRVEHSKRNSSRRRVPEEEKDSM